MRRITFRGQPGQGFTRPISTNSLWHVPVIPSYAGGCDQEDPSARQAHGKKLPRPYLNGKKIGHGGIHVSPSDSKKLKTGGSQAKKQAPISKISRAK
jgi:hypothetical protein